MKIKELTSLVPEWGHTKTLYRLFRQYLDKERSRRCAFRLLCILLAFVAGSGLMGKLPGFYLSCSGSYICFPIDERILGPEDFPFGVDTRFPDLEPVRPGAPDFKDIPENAVGPLVSGEMSSVDMLMDGPLTGHYGFMGPVQPTRRRGLVNFSFGLVSIDTVDGEKPVALLRHSPIPLMPAAPDPFQTDMFTPGDYSEGDLPPLLYGEETDEKGLPVRWSRYEDSVPGLMACSLVGNYSTELHRLMRGLRFTSPGADFRTLANRYRVVANRYAEKYNLASALVMAIIHTESNFNPFAVSRSQAVGLMQIVPETAGNEVYRYLTGVQGKPNLETLFTPEHNIKYGTIYLHLLIRRYFGNVINPSSRQMCAIAAYNGGPGAVLRLFHSDQDAAISRINSMTPEQVYKALTTEMPNAETRRYVDLVLGRMRHY